MSMHPIVGRHGDAGFLNCHPDSVAVTGLAGADVQCHQLSGAGWPVRLAARRALTLLPRQRVMYAVGAFFLSHLLYTIWFASQLTLSFFWPLPLVLLVFGALLMAVIWSRLEEMKMPVLTFIGMTLVMVWLAGELWFARPTNTALSGFAGAALLLLSNAVWLVSHYRRRFRADNAIAAAFYFAGHFLIVRALYL